jgi:hypothetical protein
MRAVLGGVLALALLLSGCSWLEDTGPKTDEHGCLVNQGDVWCEAKDECINSWESYCPKEDESTRLITANDCEHEGGLAVDYGGGGRCNEDQKVIGEVAGLLSLHVCCYPRPEGWEGY